MSSRLARGLNTRRRIHDAAVECIYEGGYEAASIDRIVLKAGVTKGGFYHHFSSKEDLLAEIHNKFMDSHLEELRAISESPLDPREKIRSIIYCLVSGAYRYQKEEAIFFEEHRRLSGDNLVGVKAKRDEFRNIITSFIDDGIAEGVIQDVLSSKVLSFGIVGMASWTYLWIQDRGLSTDQIADMYADTILYGLNASPRKVGEGLP